MRAGSAAGSTDGGDGGAGGNATSTISDNDNANAAGKQSAIISASNSATGGDSGAGGAPAAGGNAVATTTVYGNATSSVTTNSTADANNGSSGGAGGSAKAYATSEGSAAGAAVATASATAVAFGGNGGDVAETTGESIGELSGGLGGSAVGTATAVGSSSASAEVNAEGGIGGDGTNGADGGAGGSAKLSDAAVATVTGTGALSEQENAAGGGGGTSDTGAGGAGGVASATSHVTAPTTSLSVYVADEATGGAGAAGASASGAGGAGTVTIVADGPGEVQGYGTAIGGAGPAVGGAATANVTVDAGTTADSSAAADAGGSNSGAGKAIATDGGEGGTRLDIEANANSISTNSSLAVYGVTGESSLDWFGSNSGTAWTQTQYGSALPAFLANGNAEAAGSASPTAAVYNPILTAEPTIKSGLSGDKILSIGELEAVNDSDASAASQTATAEITTDVNLSTLNENGALALGLYDGAEIGSGAEIGQPYGERLASIGRALQHLRGLGEHGRRRLQRRSSVADEPQFRDERHDDGGSLAERDVERGRRRLQRPFHSGGQAVGPSRTRRAEESTIGGRLQPGWRVRNALHRPAAIGDDGLAGHVGSFVAGEIAHDVGDLPRGGEPLHRHARDHPILLQRTVGQSLIDELGSGEAGGDGVDANARRGDFERQRPGEAEDAGLRRAIGAASRQADKSRGRGDADDGAALAARRHARHRFGRAEEEAGEVRRDDRRPVGERNFPDEADALDAGVVDEDVDLARLRIDRLERVGYARGIGRHRLRDRRRPRAARRRRSCRGRRPLLRRRAASRRSRRRCRAPRRSRPRRAPQGNWTSAPP